MTKNAVWIILMSILFLLPTFVCAQHTENELTSSFQRVEIPNTEVRYLTSSIRQQDYEVYIHLPGNYNSTDAGYSVIYLLDAQWDFPLLTAIYGQQYYDGFLPGVIIVGITWGGESPDYDALRAGDFTPTHLDRTPLSGKAGAFLTFIKEELIPFIESHYRTQEDRTLMGSSLGGLFTLYALFQAPTLFHRYVLTSPATGWDNDVIYQYEKAYAENRSHIAVKLYMAAGELEGSVSGFLKMADHLKTQKYKGMELQTQVLAGMGHSGGKAEGYTRGLQTVFTRPALVLDSDLLDRYVGDYQSTNGNRLEMVRENQHLLLWYPGRAAYPLQAETAKDFYFKGEFLNIHFNTNDKGDIVGLQLDRFSGSESYQRIKK